MRKSQISLFITLGLVIIITFALALSLKTFFSKKTAQKETKLTQQVSILREPIERLVNSCIENTVLNGIKLVGKQGGAIYIEQGGIHQQTSNHLKHENLAVLYGIDLPTTITTVNYLNPDYPYPWACFPYLDTNGGRSKDVNIPCGGTESYESPNNEFGSNNLVPLNKNIGLTPIPNSIQETLEKYVKNNLVKCLDFDRMREQALEVYSENITTRIGINLNNLAVEVRMPTYITKTRTNEEFYIDKYNINIPIRLGKVYQFINEMIIKDITDIRFDVVSDKHTLTNFDTEITVSIINDVAPVFHHDIIIVKDMASNIDDGFVFKFSRKNRRPALKYMQQTDKSTGGRNTPLNINDFSLMAYDPDEDIFTNDNYIFDPGLGIGISPGQSKTFKVTLSEGDVSSGGVLINLGYMDSQNVVVVGKN